MPRTQRFASCELLTPSQIPEAASATAAGAAASAPGVKGKQFTVTDGDVQVNLFDDADESA